jgi:hypothetical protein
MYVQGSYRGTVDETGDVGVGKVPQTSDEPHRNRRLLKSQRSSQDGMTEYSRKRETKLKTKMAKGHQDPLAGPWPENPS